MWYLTKLALQKRTVTFLLAALLVAVSFWATFQLKREMIPDIEFSLVTILTVYPDASPDEVVSEVTMPIEDVIWERWEGKGLKRQFSTSSDQISVVFAEFEYGTDMTEVSDSIGEGIDQLDLPPEVLGLPQINPQLEDNPRIIPINLEDMLPLVILTLSGDLPPDKLQEIADTEIVRPLQDINGVFKVETLGGEKDHVVVAPDPEKMNEFGISMYQIAALLSLNSEYDALSDIGSVSMGVDGVVLEDVADVAQEPTPRTVITRSNGKTSVGIEIMKEDGANTVDVANAVVNKAEKLQESLGDGVVLAPMFDQSEFIEDSIWKLTQMALIGAVLAIIVVFIFLMAFRASLVTAMSIPFSILVGFMVMYFYGITINLLTLSAMAIAVGRLIDNSIVVVEVIYRRLQQGENFKEAAINGAREVATPITSSTLATVAIFLPLIFVGGIIGELFLPFALTITFALIASLIVALMVVPAFSGYFVSRKTDGKARVEVRGTWYQGLYVHPLKWALHHRAVVLIVTTALFFGSLFLIPIIGTSFMPSMNEKMLIVTIEMPTGTDIGTTSNVAAQVESLLEGNDAIESYHTTIGTTGASLSGAMSAAQGGGDNTAEITIFLEPSADMEKERDDLELASKGIGGDNGVTVDTGESAMSHQMGGSGLDVSIQGESYADLEVATNGLYERLEGIDGLTNLENQLAQVVPKLVIEKNASKISDLGLAPQQLQQLDQELYLLRMGGPLHGVSANIDGESYGVFIKGIAEELDKAENSETLTKTLRIGYGWPQAIALGDIADVAVLQRPTHIGRIDRNLSASITGEITEKNVGLVNRQVDDEIDALLANLETDKEVTIKTGGIAEEMRESFSSMGIAIIAAIVIAYVILVVSMRSILNPLIILVSLPLASIGALLGLLIAGYPLGISGMMGVLLLVGIVLTNAIMLITLVEQLRKQGMTTYDALVEGGRTRLRPILMTALTTMVAMVPLALGVGEGALIAAELAVVVIGGLFSSTLLTLLVIPVVYSLVDGLRRRVARTG